MERPGQTLWGIALRVRSGREWVCGDRDAGNFRAGGGRAGRAAEDLLEIVMHRYERCSTLLTSNRPVEDWGKLLGDVAAVSAMLDRLLHHGHVLKCGPRSWRTKTAAASPA
jgi:IstB-like ATP binding protein